MEAVVAVDDPRAGGRGAGELQRRLDRLRARVREHDGAEVRRGAAQQLLREHARQGGDAHLRQRRGVGGQEALELRADRGVVAADREHAVAPEHVEIAVAVRVDQVRALTVRPGAVEADRAQNAAQLGIDVALVQGQRLALAAREDLGDVQARHDGGRLARHARPSARSDCFSDRLRTWCVVGSDVWARLRMTTSSVSGNIGHAAPPGRPVPRIAARRSRWPPAVRQFPAPVAGTNTDVRSPRARDGGGHSAWATDRVRRSQLHNMMRLYRILTLTEIVWRT